MEQENLELFLSTVKINQTIDSVILQGSTDRKLYIELRDENKAISLTNDAEVTVIVAYEPKLSNNKWSDKGGYTYNKDTLNYKVDIEDETRNGTTYSLIKMQMQEQFTSYAGKCSLSLKVKDKTTDGVEIEFYTMPINYEVYPTVGYVDVFSNDNRSTFDKLVTQVAYANAELSKKVNVDLSNLSPEDKLKFTGPTGPRGIEGQRGPEGSTPSITIGANKNLFINGVDSGVRVQGQEIYEFWLSLGHNGTREECLEWLRGQQGLKGNDGATPFINPKGNWEINGKDLGVRAAGKDGEQGVAGLNGKDGTNGTDGATGKDGELLQLMGDDSQKTTQPIVEVLGSTVELNNGDNSAIIHTSPYFTFPQALYSMTGSMNISGNETGVVLPLNKREYDYKIKAENNVFSVYDKGKYIIILTIDSDSLLYQNQPDSAYDPVANSIDIAIEMKTEEGNNWEAINCDKHTEVDTIRMFKTETFRGRRILKTSCAFVEDGGEIRVWCNNKFTDPFLIKSTSNMSVYKVMEEMTDQFDHCYNLKIFDIYRNNFYNKFKFIGSLYEKEESKEQKINIKFDTQLAYLNYINFAEVSNYYNNNETGDNGEVLPNYYKKMAINVRDKDPDVDGGDSTIPQSVVEFDEGGLYEFEYMVDINRDDNDDIGMEGSCYIVHRWWEGDRWHYIDYPMSVFRSNLKRDDKTTFRGKAIVNVEKYEDVVKNSYGIIATTNTFEGNPQMKTFPYDDKINFPATSAVKLIIKKI